MIDFDSIDDNEIEEMFSHFRPRVILFGVIDPIVNPDYTHMDSLIEQLAIDKHKEEEEVARRHQEGKNR